MQVYVGILPPEVSAHLMKSQLFLVTVIQIKEESPGQPRSRAAAPQGREFSSVSTDGADSPLTGGDDFPCNSGRSARAWDSSPLCKKLSLSHRYSDVENANHTFVVQIKWEGRVWSLRLRCNIHSSMAPSIWTSLVRGFLIPAWSHFPKYGALLPPFWKPCSKYSILSPSSPRKPQPSLKALCNNSRKVQTKLYCLYRLSLEIVWKIWCLVMAQTFSSSFQMFLVWWSYL